MIYHYQLARYSRVDTNKLSFSVFVCLFFFCFFLCAALNNPNELKKYVKLTYPPKMLTTTNMEPYVHNL